MRFVVFVVTLGFAMEALPCRSLPRDLRSVEIPDGATVPTDVVFLGISGEPVDQDGNPQRWTLRNMNTDVTQVMSVEVGVFTRVSPATELEPDTEYQALLEVSRDGVFAFERGFARRFRTSAGPAAALAQPSVVTVVATPARDSPLRGCLFTDDEAVVEIQLAHEEGVAALIVEREGTLLPFGTALADPAATTNGIVFGDVVDGAGAQYTITALDQAGNRVSVDATLDAALGCSSTSSAPLAIFGLALLRRRRR